MALWKQAEDDHRVGEVCTIMGATAVAQHKQVGTLAGAHITGIGTEWWFCRDGRAKCQNALGSGNGSCTNKR